MTRCPSSTLYYQQNRERCRQKAKERYYRRKKECPEAIMLEHARGRANRNGLEFNIELSDIQIPEHCPILGIKLEFGKGKVCSNSPVLDRKDNNGGYTKGNIAVISSRANRIKTDMSIEQVRRLYEYITGTLE
jgi:hypothetical protein